MKRVLLLILSVVVGSLLVSCPWPSDTEGVNDCVAELEIGFYGDDSSGRVMRDLILPTENLLFDTEISWESSDPSIINSDGRVIRSTLTADTPVTLTASVARGFARKEKQFSVTVVKTGPRRKFWVEDASGTLSWTAVDCELIYQTPKANIWVRGKDLYMISNPLLKEYGDYFTDESYPSVSSIVHTPTEFFNEPGDRINILFYSMMMDASGYFWAKDYYEDPYSLGIRSNETNIFYMNIESAVSSEAEYQAYYTLFTKGTLTHEFQHMCQAQYFYFDSVGALKESMDSWADEMSSVVMESLYAGQSDIYSLLYNRDSNGDFASGQNDFLTWPQSFTPYISAYLFGTYMFSQLASDSNREAFIKTWLSYSGDGSTSVHDLVKTLEDAAVGLRNSSTDILNDSAVQLFWDALFEEFLQGVSGQGSNGAAFYNYLAGISLTVPPSQISPVFASSEGTAFSLKASGFILGKTRVNNLASTSPADASASGALSAYIFSYHDGIPFGTELLSGSVSIGYLEARESTRAGSQGGIFFPYNSPMMRDRWLSEEPAQSRGSSRGSVSGGVKTFYIAR